MNRNPPSRQPISVLSADLASQIAAGEVVERPASVVKELIENSLDAGAARVEVTIEAGGIALIEVSDDGAGMHPSDAHLSLCRHATSKLSAFSDLDELSSYGFRGEALPSIASVSRLSVVTRHGSEDAGLSLLAEGTTSAKQAPCARPVGTTISVRDLFYNVPARRKFLRSSNTESGHVSEVVQDAALTRPDVSFRLARDGRTVRHFERVPSRLQRVEQVLDERELSLLEGQRGPVTVEAFLAPTARARRGAQGLKLLINGRPVRDRALAATVAHAFGPSLEKGRYPRGVIYIEMPRRLVDINVHPQKTEVRFADARAICDALYSIVARGLNSSPASSSGVASPAPADTAQSSSAARRAVELKTERAPISGRRFGTAEGAERVSRPAPVPLSKSSVTASPPAGERQSDLERASHEVNQVLRASERNGRALRYLGQAQDAYLVCCNADAVFMLDQHAADEVNIFVRLQQSYRKGGLQSQALLFPTVLSLTKKETELIEKRNALLLRLGLDLRVRSDKTVSLHGVMGSLRRATPEATVRAFLEAAPGARDEATLVTRFFSILACQEAVKRGTSLGLGDAQTVLKGLSSIDLEQGHPDCIHGRPLLSSTSFLELSRKAER